MELGIDLSTGTSKLTDLDDTKRFHLRVTAPPDASAPTHAETLARVLASTHLGRLDDNGSAYVQREAVAFQAAGAVKADWDASFEEMSAYAAEHGFVDDQGGIQIHVVWPGP